MKSRSIIIGSVSSAKGIGIRVQKHQDEGEN